MFSWQALGCVGVFVLIAPASAPRLAGSKWTSSYYYYHEDWTFVSADSVAIRWGQWGWSMPIDTGMPEDSLYLTDPETLAYQFDGDWLLLSIGASAGVDSFRWDDGRFVSKETYTYGNVVLTPGPNTDCKRHGP